MANQDHIKIIEQGAEAWNAWRDANPEVVPDLSDWYAVYSTSKGNIPDLTGVNLSGANLSGAYFQRPDRDWPDEWPPEIANADLRGADLSGADLSGFSMRGARYDSNTIWPEGFNPQSAGAIKVD